MIASAGSGKETNDVTPHVETDPAHLARKLMAAVPPPVVSVLVHPTPEPRMLRRGEYDPAPGNHDASELRKRRLVVVEVLQNVESARNVEDRVVRERRGIGAHKGRGGDA